MNTYSQTYTRTPKRSGVLDSQDPWSGFWRIFDPTFLFSHGILGILDLRQKRHRWILSILNILGKVVVGSCGPWTSHNNNATVSWRPFKSNDILLMITRISVLLKLERLRIPTHIVIDSAILCWLENKLTLLAPSHIMSLRMLLIECDSWEMNAQLMRGKVVLDLGSALIQPQTLLRYQMHLVKSTASS